jgi:hypothetical protein
MATVTTHEVASGDRLVAAPHHITVAAPTARHTPPMTSPIS